MRHKVSVCSGARAVGHRSIETWRVFTRLALTATPPSHPHHPSIHRPTHPPTHPFARTLSNSSFTHASPPSRCFYVGGEAMEYLPNMHAGGESEASTLPNHQPTSQPRPTFPKPPPNLPLTSP